MPLTMSFEWRLLKIDDKSVANFSYFIAVKFLFDKPNYFDTNSDIFQTQNFSNTSSPFEIKH